MILWLMSSFNKTVNFNKTVDLMFKVLLSKCCSRLQILLKSAFEKCFISAPIPKNHANNVLPEEWKKAWAESASLCFKPPLARMAFGNRHTYRCNFLGSTKLQKGQFMVTEVKLMREIFWWKLYWTVSTADCRKFGI